MSKQLQSILIEPLDARVLKGMIEKIGSLKINADKANQALADSVADYKEYMGRSGVDEADVLSYKVNVISNQLEPIPAPAPPKPPVTAPDAGDPPAPFVDQANIVK